MFKILLGKHAIKYNIVSVLYTSRIVLTAEEAITTFMGFLQLGPTIYTLALSYTITKLSLD